MADICVYTHVAGDYEKRLYAPRAQSRRVRFVCYTDSERLAGKGWELRRPLQPRHVQRADLANRWHKLFAHALFPSADYSIYVDANLQVAGDLMPLIEQLDEAGAALGAGRHPERSRPADEIDACLAANKFKADDRTRAEAQRSFYEAEGLPEAALLAAGLLVRRHASPLLAQAMEVWWTQIRTYTARDQISLPYALWKTQLPWLAYDFDILRPNRYTIIHGHGQQPSPLQLLKRRMSRTVRVFASPAQ